MGSRKTPSRSRTEHRRRVRQRQWTLLLLGVAAIASVPLWLNPLGRLLAVQLTQHTEHFRVHREIVTGNHWIPADTVLALARVPMDAPLASLPVAEIEQRVMQHAWIASAQVRRRPPDLVEIRIAEREPVAAIRSTTLWIGTADGVAVVPVSNDWIWDLPVLTAPRSMKLEAGQAITNHELKTLLAQVVLLRAASPETWRNLNEIHWQKDRLVATFSQPALELLLAPDADELVWSSFVRFLASAPPEELAEARSLDARHPGHLVVRRDSPINQEREIG